VWRCCWWWDVPQDDCLLSTCVSDTVSISLPTHQQLVASLRASILEVAPLLHCSTLPPAHIGNFVEHHSHRAQVTFKASRSAAAVMTGGDMSCQLYLLPVRISGQHKPVVHKAQCQEHTSRISTLQLMTVPLASWVKWWCPETSGIIGIALGL
jgi:hypothetical protein